MNYLFNKEIAAILGYRVVNLHSTLGFLGAATFGFGFGAALLVATLPLSHPSARGRVTSPLQEFDAPQENVSQNWPALFGTPPPKVPETASNAPLETTTAYSLKGLVANGPASWAIVNGPDGDLLIGVGLVLPDGSTVVSITAEGAEIIQEGRRFLVSFPTEAETERATLETSVATSNPQEIPPSTIPIEELRKQDFRRMLALAGGTEIIDFGDGVLAQEIIWVRKGRFYDQIGLRKGDTILTINGIAAGDIEAITRSIPELIQMRSFDLVLFRAGAKVSLNVKIDE